MSVRVLRAPWVLLGRAPGSSVRPAPVEACREPVEPGRTGAIPDGAIALDGDTILAVGPRAEVEARHGRAEPLDGLVLPALVNAHLHLELSHLAGAIEGGDGLPAWIERFVAGRASAGERDPAPAMAAAAEELVRAGVAAVGDVSNTLASVEPLARAGVAGTIFHEVFGVTERRFSEALRAAEEARARAPSPPPGLRIVPSPHAVYSTHHPSLVGLLRGGPGSLHLAEDPAERALVAEGTGGFARLLARMGAGGERLTPAARSAVALVAPHLARHHLAVHCVDLDGEDLAALAATGATAVLCPRSNRFIGGARPRLDALLEAGIPLAAGTDSLASSPSLAPLAEVAALRRAFPAIPASRIVPLAWNGPAVGAPQVGALVAGRAPGVLFAPVSGRAEDPFEALVAFAESGRPFGWLARQRPPPGRNPA